MSASMGLVEWPMVQITIDFTMPEMASGCLPPAAPFLLPGLFRLELNCHRHRNGHDVKHR